MIYVGSHVLVFLRNVICWLIVMINSLLVVIHVLVFLRNVICWLIVMINSLLVVIHVLGFLCNLLTYLIIDSLLVTTLNLKITDIVRFWWQIKKFRDALAKHTPDRCSLEPTKGLEEKELIALSENKDLNFTYTPKPSQPVHTPEEVATEAVPSLTSKSEVSKERPLVTAWRWCGQFVSNHIFWLHPLYSLGWV